MDFLFKSLAKTVFSYLDSKIFGYYFSKNILPCIPGFFITLFFMLVVVAIIAAFISINAMFLIWLE